jgi:hypothetical protein
VAQLYPRALGSLYIVFYDSQGYGGGILILPLPGGTGPRIYRLQEYFFVRAVIASVRMSQKTQRLHDNNQRVDVP